MFNLEGEERVQRIAPKLFQWTVAGTLLHLRMLALVRTSGTVVEWKNCLFEYGLLVGRVGRWKNSRSQPMFDLKSAPGMQAYFLHNENLMMYIREANIDKIYCWLKVFLGAVVCMLAPYNSKIARLPQGCGEHMHLNSQIARLPKGMWSTLILWLVIRC